MPLLQTQLVAPGWLSSADFLAGYGAAQAVSGRVLALVPMSPGTTSAAPAQQMQVTSPLPAAESTEPPETAPVPSKPFFLFDSMIAASRTGVRCSPCRYLGGPRTHQAAQMWPEDVVLFRRRRRSSAPAPPLARLRAPARRFFPCLLNGDGVLPEGRATCRACRKSYDQP